MRGFSLIEMIVVLAILLLTVGIALAAYRSFGRNITLETAAQALIVTLDDARNRTLGSRGDSRYGVHVDTDAYTLFTGPTFDAAAGTNEVHALPAGIEISATSLAGGGSDVVFNSLTGQTEHSGTIELHRSSDPTATQTITISSAGQADVAGSVNPTDTRLTDTRHVHFTLGWTIQGTSTLNLTFSDPSHIESVSMTDYFNSDQTDFDYEANIDVGGDNERLRLQSHSIDATNTTLSIERDRRNNEKAVAISIDGRDIVSYAPDGPAAVGPDGGTMQIQ